MATATAPKRAKKTPAPAADVPAPADRQLDLLAIAPAPAAAGLSVTCDRADLLATLQAVAPAAKGRTPSPALRCARLSAGPPGTSANALTADATDLVLWLRRATERVSVESPGVVLVDAGDLLARVAAAGDGPLRLIATADALHVRAADGAAWHLPTHANPGDFPPGPDAPTPDERVAEFAMPVEALREAVAFVDHARSTEASRYAFQGVGLEAEAGKLCVVATDGKRLAVDRPAGVMGIGAKDGWRAVVGTDGLAKALRSMPDEGDVTVRIERSAVRLACGPLAVARAALLEGQFSPWREVVPRADDLAGSATTDRAAFAAAVGRAMLSTSEQRIGVRMVWRPGAGVVMSSASPERGAAEVPFPCKVEGQGVEIGVNPQFLVAALSAFAGDEVRIGWQSPNRPILLTTGDQLAVVMPVNLQ